jgi:RHS repeat-associated protein
MSRLEGVSTTETLPAYSNCASAWSGSVAWASSAAYTTANQLSSLTRFIGVVQSCPSGDVFNTTSEIFKYNVNNQLTDIETGTPVVGSYGNWLKDGANYILAGYHYSATQNNGQITSMDDGRQEYSVTYQYDLLKRLVSATAGSNWTQTFGYDGFGNLTSKSTPSGSSELPLPGVNPAKNWLTGYTYDANGNVGSYNNYSLGYDPVNRLSYATTGSFIETYAYDASNHRIERINSALDTVYFFSPSGALLSEFNCLSTCTLIYNRIYFGGMVLGTDGAGVYGNPPSALGDVSTWMDRLGSAQSTYPYGTDIGSSPAGADALDFATYTKEGSTGLEYAMNRYFSGGFGRFMTPDFSGKGTNPANPQTWSGYAYASGDPTNEFDPTGQEQDLSCGMILALEGDSALDGSWDCSNDNPWLTGGVQLATSIYLAKGLADAFANGSGQGSSGGQSSSNTGCDLQLYTQPAGNKFDPFSHTYTELLMETNGVLTAPPLFYESGPVSKTTGKEVESFSNAWNNSLDRSPTGSPNSNAYALPSTLEWQTGFSLSECAVNLAVTASDAKYPQNTMTYSFPSPNSNSFTYTLLRMSGVPIPWWVNVDLRFGQIAPGWGTFTPW